MRESEIREKMEKEIKIRSFTNTWITMPCLIVSLLMFFYQPNLLWLFLIAFNGMTAVLNWTASRLAYRALEQLDTVSEHDRKKRIDDLYGR